MNNKLGAGIAAALSSVVLGMGCDQPRQFEGATVAVGADCVVW